MTDLIDRVYAVLAEAPDGLTGRDVHRRFLNVANAELMSTLRRLLWQGCVSTHKVRIPGGVASKYSVVGPLEPAQW